MVLKSKCEVPVKQQSGKCSLLRGQLYIPRPYESLATHPRSRISYINVIDNEMCNLLLALERDLTLLGARWAKMY